MRHTLCFIDDKIPVSQVSKYFDETGLITGSMISFLLSSNDVDWQDAAIKQLCAKLTDQKEEWSVSAFTAPQFYENYVSENVYAPEIIIYDWDYNGIPGSNDSEQSLLSILRSSYTMVFIFSEEENIDEIQQIIQNSSFLAFQDRLSVVAKGDENCVDSIFQQFSDKEKEVFSFNYGHQLVLRSHKAINAILSDIAQLSIESFIASFSSGVADNGIYKVDNCSFVDTIIPRFRFELLRNGPDCLEYKQTKDPDLTQMRKVWSYRLYDTSKTPFVSMGDIVRHIESGEFFLVISSDCHMEDFWHKNGGSIMLVPMSSFNTDYTKHYVKSISKEFHPSSIANHKNHITVFPSVPTGGNEYTDLVLFPKCVKSDIISRHEDYQSSRLSYEVFDGYSKVCSLLDPFKSPVIEFVIGNISGYGCPDFPEQLKNNILEKFKQSRQ